ncbi:MAG: hypothetical protein Q9219_006831 [cf. Caloplaca sp. 3 TL-2023]
MRELLRRALLLASLSSNLGAHAAGITLTTRIPVCYPSGGTGDGSSGVVQTVSSTYGVYTLKGCYAAPASGYLLDGKTTVSPGTTLASCAAFCAGSVAFAVQNGNAAESCGSANTCLVYTSSPPPGSGTVSTGTYLTTLSGGIVSTATRTTTLPPAPTGSVSFFTQVTTYPGGSLSTVTGSTTIIPGPPVSSSVVVTTYTTTGPGGSSIVVTSSTTIPPAPTSSSVVATTYTTTGPGGSITVVTSSTTIPPAPTSSSVVATTYTTTGPGGSATVVTSSTTIPAPPPASVTSATTYVTTNSQGSSFTTAQTTTVPPPVSSSNPSPPSYSAACAGSRSYSDNLGTLWHVDCGIDYPGYDLGTITVPSFEACLQSCDTYKPTANGLTCLGISYGIRDNGGECYRKYNVSETRYFPGFDSAYKDNSHVGPQSPTSFSVSPLPTANSSPPNVSPPTTVIVQTSTNNQGSVVVSSTTSTSPLPPNVSPPTTVIVQTSTNDQGSVVVSSTTSTSPLPPNVSPPTTVIVQTSTNNEGSVVLSSTTSTASNPVYSPWCGQIYRDLLGTDWYLDCGTAYPGNDLPSQTVSSYEACLEACDNYRPSSNVANGARCVSVTYGIRTNGGECYLKYNITQSIPAGGQDSAYQIGSGVRPPGSVTTSPAVTPSPSASNTPSLRPTTSTSSATSDPSSLFQPCPFYNNQPFPDRAGVVYDISGTAKCPQNRGAIYTDSYGQQYEIHCGQQVDGDNTDSAFHADSFEKCVNICEVIGGCQAVTYGGDVVDITQSNCYPYTSFRFYSTQAVTDTLLSARPLNGSTSPNFANSDQVCPAYNGIQYREPIGRTYGVNCGRGYVNPNDLYAVVVYTLEACMAYCSLYRTCVAVTFTAYTPNVRNGVNCYPRSTIGTLENISSGGSAYLAS